MNTLVVVLEITALVACAALGVLWIRDPSGPYEPQIVLAGFVFVGAEMYRRYQQWITKGTPAVSPNTGDAKLFAEFCALFTDTDAIRFFKEHDFGASFERARVGPLYQFVETWDNAAHEFVDAKLEQGRKRTYDSAKSLAMKIAQKTVPIGGDMLSVKPRNLPAGPTPEWVRQDARDINALVPGFVEAHEQFIRLGRKVLK